MTDEVVYLDYAASTPVDARVADFLCDLLADRTSHANPSSVHRAGRRASDIVERAADRLAGLVNCSPADLVWTSGATESDNLAIIGAARFREHRGKHLITMPTEHKAVTDVFQALEKRGFDVTWLAPKASGVLDPRTLENAIRDDTQLVSVMYVNNETGVEQDIASLGKLCRDRDVLFHVDAAQAIGKRPVDLATLPVDLVSMTAHKMYGPKGVGALFVADRPRCHLEPLFFGGAQQRRLRPGTLPTPQIAAFGYAAEIAAESMAADLEHVTRLHDRLWAGVRTVDGVLRNGDAGQHYPGILNISVQDVEGESLLLALEPLCVATGSACNSLSREPSHVLRALGRSDAMAESAIRLSYGRGTTDADIDFAVLRYRDAVRRLRDMAPARVA